MTHLGSLARNNSLVGTILSARCGGLFVSHVQGNGRRRSGSMQVFNVNLIVDVNVLLSVTSDKAERAHVGKDGIGQSAFAYSRLFARLKEFSRVIVEAPDEGERRAFASRLHGMVAHGDRLE